MARRLYIETNFIISVANGEHEANDRIIETAVSGSLELALPQICIDEALSASIKDRERMQEYLRPLRPQVREYGRSRQLVTSRAASSRLQSAILAIEKADGERLTRLRWALSVLVNSATLLPAVLTDSHFDDEFRRDPFDAIVAKTIGDQNRVFGRPSLLLSANKDFDSDVLGDYLAGAAVTRAHHPEKVLALLRSEESEWR